MKLAAALQILLLLATTLLPEGRYSLAPGGSCAETCGCSKESRSAGSCCCSKKAALPKAAGTASAKSCCASAKSCSASGKVADTKSCCQKAASTARCGRAASAARTCCQQKDAGTGKQSSPPWSVVSQCPCGTDSAELHVVCMPRTRAISCAVQSQPETCERLVVTDDMCSPLPPAPATPPPQSFPC